MSDKTPTSPLQETARSLRTTDPVAAYTRRLAMSLGVLVFAAALFVRIVVSLHPYSGTYITYNLPALVDIGTEHVEFETAHAGATRDATPLNATICTLDDIYITFILAYATI